VDALAALRLTVGTAFLLVAAGSDLRTRKVRDALWIVLGTIGLLLASAEILLSGFALERLGLVGASAFLFYAIFFGKPLVEEDGIRLRPARLALFLAAALLTIGVGVVSWTAGGAAANASAELVSMPVMVLVYQGFYYVGLLHGGADAKALIAITLLVPLYPAVTTWISTSARVSELSRRFFPFSLVVFVDAAILFLLVPVAYMVYNGIRGDLRLPQALFGYRANLDSLPKHVWLMEQIDEGGEHILVLFPKRGKDLPEEIERLRAAGIRRPWVQPKMPFLAPLAAGYVLAFLTGNLLLLLFPPLA